MKLDLGCGENKNEGYLGVDIFPGPQVDIIVDLEKFPWSQFRDNSVDEVCSSHYVEHAPDLVAFMDEVWRICKDGASVVLVAPYYSSMRATQDPTHKNYISEKTWDYFDREIRNEGKVGHYPIMSNFKKKRVHFQYDSPWDSKSEEEQEFARRYYMNVVRNICVELTVVKK